MREVEGMTDSRLSTLQNAILAVLLCRVEKGIQRGVSQLTT